jgi:hypothetical protein
MTRFNRMCPDGQPVTPYSYALSRDGRGAFRSEIDKGRRHILGPSDANILTQPRGQCLAPRQHFGKWLQGRHCFGHGRQGVRNDGIDGDAGAAQFERPRPRQGGDAGLGRRIGRLPEITALAGDGRNEDQPPALPRLAERARRGAATGERPAKMGFDHRVEIFVARVPEGTIPQNSGIAGHDVEPAKGFDGPRHAAFGSFGRADGSHMGGGLAA